VLVEIKAVGDVICDSGQLGKRWNVFYGTRIVHGEGGVVDWQKMLVGRIWCARIIFRVCWEN